VFCSNLFGIRLRPCLSIADFSECPRQTSGAFFIFADFSAPLLLKGGTRHTLVGVPYQVLSFLGCISNLLYGLVALCHRVSHRNGTANLEVSANAVNRAKAGEVLTEGSTPPGEVSFTQSSD